MNIKISLNKDFEKTFTALTAKYGEDFEILNGLHESQLDFSEFIDGFVDKNVADASIDGNANAHHKDICSLCGEKGKSEDKLFAFNKIFYELKKKYGLRTAKEWLETEYTGGFYLHDAPSSTYKPYCYAYDLSRLAREGLFFLEDYNNKGPKHLTTFLDDTIEFVSFFSNRSSGACGLPNVLLWTFYFWKKDCEQGYYLLNEDYYLRQFFQKFIFRLNQPFLRVNQSA
jgi:ribonucleoside-triphosphate reductase